ncbi:GGDEF domain-containing protein [Duganella callida]|uniref:GGDEF domain-containing protein n=2 Tax=Duganella callida TaxID=2561932 RepID=A0A4Y9SAP9_9BURK|nr:GGDEF domain-containing protein [Duganella callida]
MRKQVILGKLLHPGKGSRRFLVESRSVVYGFLVVLMALSVGLSWTFERTANTIRKNADPAIHEDIPQLRFLLDMDSAILRYEQVLDGYYSQTINVAQYLYAGTIARKEMESALEGLRRLQRGDPSIDALYLGYLSLERAASKLERTATNDGSPRAASVQKLIFDHNENAKALRLQINSLKNSAQQALSGSGDKVDSNIKGLAYLVHWYDAFALLSCGLMIYHIREKFRVEKELHHQAGHDPLTGLPHRRAFVARLKSMSCEPSIVVLGTIDGYSRLVGGYGHAFADQVMVNIALLIERAAKLHGGEVYRLDGANFAILYGVGSSGDELGDSTERLRETVRYANCHEGKELHVTLSLGTARYPEDGLEPDVLLRNADAALQAASKAGGDVTIEYGKKLNEQLLSRLQLETDLRHAIERGELELYYQPQQSMNDEGLIGFEALIRWRRNGELVSPASFIPLAEETGLIVTIGDWVLEQSCLQLQKWMTDAKCRITVAVNISPLQFADPFFVNKVERIITASGVNPACIELEITEGVMVNDIGATTKMLKALQNIGVRLAIDDFGTGYSSLSYLTQLPVEKLKIDQSFVRDITVASPQQTVVQATIGLAHNLGMIVIAEGVETEVQQRLLKSWGCDEIQGYYYSRPLQASAASVFLYSRKITTIVDTA